MLEDLIFRTRLCGMKQDVAYKMLHSSGFIQVLSYKCFHTRDFKLVVSYSWFHTRGFIVVISLSSWYESPHSFPPDQYHRVEMFGTI